MMTTVRHRVCRAFQVPRGPGRNERGFSLIEMMIAMTVLGVGILSLAGLFPMAMRQVAQSDLESKATFHAQAKLEELKRFSWEELTSTAGTDTIDASYARNWDVQEDVPATGMKQVRVTVTWTDKQGPRNVSLSSFLSDSGM